MSGGFVLVEPGISPPLDPGFRPAALANRAFRREVAAAGGGALLRLGLERPDGSVSCFNTQVFCEDHPHAEANLFYAERLLKFLLWQRGGYKVYAGGPRQIGEFLRGCYAPGGRRAFDHQFLSEQVYQTPFAVVPCTAGEVPPEQEKERPLGRHLDGCRIGFDLGASDLKIAAVVDGQAVYSDEIGWDPRNQADPDYHYQALRAAIRTAAAKLPRVDAIGGSSAGIIVDNRPMVASLFRGVPAERYDQVRSLFLRLGEEMGVPLEVLNDGEVTALAGSMSLEPEGNAILGIAMGSSQAGGYVTRAGKITGWLNELAFCPVDYSPGAPVEEWSGDRGCGALYFSQQCVFRLAPQAGIAIPDGMSNAEKLEFAQDRLHAGREGAVRIWQTMGVYLGYGIAHYADFYDLEHVLILGRCTSGQGGALIVDGARQVLAAEFPELAERIAIQLPDEKSRRVGQSIAAASLPARVRTCHPEQQRRVSPGQEEILRFAAARSACAALYNGQNDKRGGDDPVPDRHG